MRSLRLLVGVLSICVVAGCGDDGGEDGRDDAVVAESTPLAAGPAVYEVPDENCPTGWIGLTVTTDNDAEIDYLDDMPACTDTANGTTYLENRSDAVWLLRTTSANLGSTTAVDLTLEEQSFVASVADRYPGQAIFVPGAKLTVDLAPEEVEWVVDLPLSFGWQTHEIVLDKVKTAGEAAAINALRHRSKAGGALASCTLAVTSYAKAVERLEDEDTSEVLLNGLGVGAGASRCRLDAASVTVVDDAGGQVALSDDLERLRAQVDVLERAHGRLNYAQRALKFLRLGVGFVR